ncbi:MAG: hypothetical protein HY537_13210 [Deltaproteobacteria bacterium]|nr:hypothetical protein [Deltaproteobacteria bacterium]
MSSPRLLAMETPTSKFLVNPISLVTCAAKCGELSARILDISFVRLVIEESNDWMALTERGTLSVDLQMDRYPLNALASFQAKGEGWIRFGFDKIVPSSQASLRSFLLPRKVGESIIEDWRTDKIRHFHGLNESELWFDSQGGVLITYLDPSDFSYHFIVRIKDSRSNLRVGRLSRKDYMDLTSIENDLPLVTMTDKETITRLGECRDIMTNFRPTGQVEYNLKQRLLKVISDHLYSTSHRVEVRDFRPPASRI